MQNCKSSARTAAQQSSKSLLLFRQPCILAMLLLCAVYLSSCKQKDWFGDDEDRNLKTSFTKGWIKGANYMDSLHSVGNVNYELVKLNLYKDSVEFSKLVDGVK